MAYLLIGRILIYTEKKNKKDWVTQLKAFVLKDRIVQQTDIQDLLNTIKGWDRGYYYQAISL